ncbi:MAG: DUF58 domain-containing protein [Micrococcales bacterium]|nr:DUF58 domain-containing protein [Micrococcales bacterium]MCL2666545.1 DUF58 domain-containing protein [Micrococcales bacterium]
MREYVEGDDLRRVHWASCSQSMVRATNTAGCLDRCPAGWLTILARSMARSGRLAT